MDGYEGRKYVICCKDDDDGCKYPGRGGCGGGTGRGHSCDDDEDDHCCQPRRGSNCGCGKDGCDKGGLEKEVDEEE